MTVGEYASQFSALLTYVPHVASSDRSKLSRFMQGLNRTVCTLVVEGGPSNYADAIEKANNVEATLLWGEQQSVQPSYPYGSGSNVPMPAGAPLYPSLGVFCDRCGGKHFSTQCSGVQGTCHVCGQVGHYARICPNSGKQQFSQPQFEKRFRGPVARPFVPTQSFQQSSYQQPRGSVPHRFSGPQQARVHALTHDQAHEAPGGVIAGYPGGAYVSGGASASGA